MASPNTANSWDDSKAWSVRCPLCGVAAHARCVTERGIALMVPHHARIDNALRIQAKYEIPSPRIED